MPGILIIEGTDGADEITLTFDEVRQVIEAANHERHIGTYALGDWESIHIDAGKGDDIIQVDPAIPLAIDVVGGEGSDTLVGIYSMSGEGEVYTLGEPMSFDNRSCISVECVRFVEGEPDEPDPMDGMHAIPFGMITGAHHGTLFVPAGLSLNVSSGNSQMELGMSSMNHATGGGAVATEPIHAMAMAATTGFVPFDSDQMQSMRYNIGTEESDNGHEQRSAGETSDADPSADETAMDQAAMSEAAAAEATEQAASPTDDYAELDAALANWTSGEEIQQADAAVDRQEVDQALAEMANEVNLAADAIATTPEIAELATHLSSDVAVIANGPHEMPPIRNSIPERSTNSEKSPSNRIGFVLPALAATACAAAAYALDREETKRAFE